MLNKDASQMRRDNSVRMPSASELAQNKCEQNRTEYDRHDGHVDRSWNSRIDTIRYGTSANAEIRIPVQNPRPSRLESQNQMPEQTVRPEPRPRSDRSRTDDATRPIETRRRINPCHRAER
ncbi:hypothetical protein H6P81_013255 [Aristolochia fimbriata]|uniref:Uncharacterized protein n=1 Tax=Aristolochia fimbriata TaxID=158543 RepID=A0AAV7EE73_ARIFI|nr:hypothetical protein H6P81_013255 [Aristolochia fimbriata]